jgi:hypothetical protein
MLINIRISELQGNTNNSILLSILIGVFFSYTFFELAYYNLGGTSSKNNLDIYLNLSVSSKKNLLNIDNNPVLFVTSNT